MIRKVAAAVFLLAATSAKGDFLSGDDLQELCSADPNNESDAYAASACLHYVIGVIDARLIEFSSCISASVTTGLLRDVVANYLKENPERGYLPASVYVVGAINEEYGWDVSFISRGLPQLPGQ